MIYRSFVFLLFWVAALLLYSLHNVLIQRHLWEVGFFNSSTQPPTRGVQQFNPDLHIFSFTGHTNLNVLQVPVKMGVCKKEARKGKWQRICCDITMQTVPDSDMYLSTLWYKYKKTDLASWCYQAHFANVLLLCFGTGIYACMFNLRLQGKLQLNQSADFACPGKASRKMLHQVGFSKEAASQMLTSLLKSKQRIQLGTHDLLKHTTKYSMWMDHVSEFLQGKDKIFQFLKAGLLLIMTTAPWNGRKEFPHGAFSLDLMKSRQGEKHVER